MDADPSPTFLALQQVLAGRFAVEREVGSGGMGVVFLARDLALDRPVAIKLLPPRLAPVPGLRDRFLQEARTAARLSHPHIVPVHTVEEHGELAFFVMGFVEGETLAQRVARAGPLAAPEALRVFQEIAWALAYAHRHGVIHRDVKPGNILLERATGRALLSDFGIAQVEPAGLSEGQAVVGTVRYMSPEQIGGGPLDGRSDLFSLGGAAYFALTGRPPFEGARSALTALAQRTGIAPVATLRPELPPPLAAIVDRCLELDPAARFPDGESLAEALDAARGRQIMVAAPVARFVDLYRTLTIEIASYASVVLVLTAELLLVSGQWPQDAVLGVILSWAFFGAIGLGVVRMIQLIRAARRLLGQGHTTGEVRQALERPEAGPGRRRRGSWLRRIGWVLAGIGGAVLWGIGFRWQISVSLGVVLDGLILALFTLAPVIGARALLARMLRPGKRGWWSRVWWKVMEWKVFRVAGLGRKPEAVPPSEPAELALGAGARELFLAMPPDLQRHLEDVPVVVERLEAQATRLRDRPDPRARERLGSTLAALEGLRLDLLRLRGNHSGGDLTGDLDAARRLADRIALLVEAREELD